MSAPQTAPKISNDPYAELERRFARLSAVNRASAILSWDRSTMMPDGASEDRADQLATLNVVAHEDVDLFVEEFGHIDHSVDEIRPKLAGARIVFE